MDREKFLQSIFDAMPQLIRFNRYVNQSGFSIDDQCQLPPLQWHAIIMIKKHAPLNMTQLANYLMMPRQQLTRIIDELVRKGLVLRQSDPGNRRHVMLALSEEGEECLEGWLYNAQGIVSRISEALTTEQRQVMTESINNIQQIMETLERSEQ